MKIFFNLILMLSLLVSFFEVTVESVAVKHTTDDFIILVDKDLPG